MSTANLVFSFSQTPRIICIHTFVFVFVFCCYVSHNIGNFLNKKIPCCHGAQMNDLWIYCLTPVSSRFVWVYLWVWVDLFRFVMWLHISVLITEARTVRAHTHTNTRTQFTNKYIFPRSRTKYKNSMKMKMHRVHVNWVLNLDFYCFISSWNI